MTRRGLTAYWHILAVLPLLGLGLGSCTPERLSDEDIDVGDPMMLPVGGGRPCAADADCAWCANWDAFGSLVGDCRQASDVSTCNHAGDVWVADTDASILIRGETGTQRRDADTSRPCHVAIDGARGPSGLGPTRRQHSRR